MIVLATGAPSPIQSWGTIVLQHILTVALGNVEVVAKSRVSDLTEAWAKRSGQHALFYFDNPEVQISKLLSRPESKAIAFIEDPAQTIAAVTVGQQIPDWRFATRIMTLFFSSLHDVYTAPSTLLIVRDKRLTIGEMINQITVHLKIELSRAQQKVVLQQLSLDPQRSLGQTVDSHLEEKHKLVPRADQTPVAMSAKELAAMDAVCASFRPLLAGRPVDQMIWPLELFIGQKPPAPPDATSHLVGIPRHLLLGPLMHLPLGRWKIQMHFKAIECFPSNKFGFEVLDGERLAYGDVSISATEEYLMSLRFEVKEPTKPLEFRCELLESALYGILEIYNVTCERDLTIQGNVAVSGETEMKPAIWLALDVWWRAGSDLDCLRIC